jgi:hypothetical protein
MRLPFFFANKALADAGPLYASIVAAARKPEWYRDAGVPDTMDGRFAVLTSLLALADIRLERGANSARELGPRLAECFIADMDVQMRQAGFGDPSLGKQVRTMEVASVNLYGESPPPAAEAGIAATREWWERLQRASDPDIAKGRIA